MFTREIQYPTLNFGKTEVTSASFLRSTGGFRVFLPPIRLHGRKFSHENSNTGFYFYFNFFVKLTVQTPNLRISYLIDLRSNFPAFRKWFFDQEN